ncbi:MAG: hypothetical protein KDA91_18340, partial [Planctomycetaceae bacterium]|nr:hypothetical protein [Planctomycetaceae bacterium]
ALLSTGIDVLFRGAAVQAAQELDVQIVDGVRNFLFGEPGQGGLDLASLNIQRGRDHGLADYNTTREAMGLPRVSSFDDISSNPMVAAALELTYGNVDNIDLWVGGLAEDHLADSSMGITFTTILVDQFQRLRDGDRFWYENIFTGTELQTLRNTTLAEVIERNTDVQFAQSNVFFTPNSEIIEFEFAPTGIRRATVKAVNEYIQIVDDVSGNIVFMHDTNDLSGLIIVGNEKLADRLVVDGSITAEMLPNGIDFRAGNVGRDRLVVHGTSGDDTITVNGNSVNLNDLDVFFEYIDELMVEGAAGDDSLTIVHPCVNKTILDGGDGNDLLVGGDSNDELYGGYGNDILRGGNGDDKLYGGPGADQLYGEGGVDQLIGGGGFDLIVEDGNEQSPDVAPRYAAFLDQFYNLRFLGNDYYNWSGRQERWFYSNKGWMFILPDGSIHLWDRLPGANGPFIGRVEVSCYQNLNELCDHSTPFNDEDTLDGVANLARQLDEQLQLRFWGSYIYNWGGRQEKWIPGKNGWYCITRDGRLWFWDGSRNSEGTLIAELNIMYFSTPSLLHDAWNG